MKTSNATEFQIGTGTFTSQLFEICLLGCLGHRKTCSLSSHPNNHPEHPEIIELRMILFASNSSDDCIKGTQLFKKSIKQKGWGKGPWQKGQA